MTEPPLIIACGTVELECAAGGGKRPTFKLDAYSGGLMTVNGFYSPVVVDLAGLTAARPNIPVLLGHDPERIVGMGAVSIDARGVTIIGTVTSDEKAGQTVVANARNGFQWQASIGAQVIRRENLEHGKTAMVNGRPVQGPAIIARQAILQETSFVAIGADSSTSATVAASSKGMGMTTETTDPIKDEQARIVGIMRICASAALENAGDIQAQAIADGWDASRTELEILRASRSKPVTSRPSAQSVANAQGEPASLLMAAAAIHIGKEELAVKAVGEHVAQRARDLRCRSFLDLCAAALTLENREIPQSHGELIRAAFSTVSLPTGLSNLMNKNIVQSYVESPATWRPFTAVRPSQDFKTQYGVRPGAVQNFDQLGPAGEVHHAFLGEEQVLTWQVDTFASTLRITRKDMVNDDLGIFSNLAQEFGKAAARTENDLMYKLILLNAGSFFGSGNANYDSGSSTALSADALASGIKAMRVQRDSQGNDLDIAPATLLVGPSNENAAKTLLQSEYIQQIATVGGPTGNPLKASLTLAVEPRLENTDKFSGASATAWYLFAKPAFSPVIFSSLSGAEGPIVEFFGTNMNAETLGASWRAYIDVGVAQGDFRAAYKAAGA